MKIGYLILLFIIFVGGIFYFLYSDKNAAPVTNFRECVESGNPVMESYPAQCRTPDGRTFTEDIGNEPEKDDLIRIFNPRPNQIVESPLLISGEARGFWFFEADFPIELRNGEGNLLAQSIARAQGEWMTEDFVPFESELTFSPSSSSGEGTLILKKDNSSGLSENEDALIVPVRF